MSKYDVYLYEGSHVLRNLLNIQDEKELDLAEAELSRANMMVLYTAFLKFTEYCLKMFMSGQESFG